MTPKPETQHQKNERELAFFTKVLAIFTVLVATAGVISLFLSWRALNDAHDATLIANRAWLFYKNTDGKVYSGSESHLIKKEAFEATFENTGNSPAFAAHCNVDVGEDPAKLGTKPLPPEIIDVGPHQHFACNPIEVSRSDLIDTWQHKKTIYIWIRVEYSDSFDKTPTRFSEFCGKVEVQFDPEPPLTTEDQLVVLKTGPRSCNRAN